MATNVTTLPLVLAAAKDISASGVGVISTIVAVLLLLAAGCLPAWLPLVLGQVPAGQALLKRVSDVLDRYGRTIVVVALAGAGLLFTIKGLFHL